MLKDFKPRLYQETIFATASMYNTLVVLPTGLGKTGIALMLTAHRLHQYPQSKVIIFAPTKPLVEQHLTTLQHHLPWTEEEKNKHLVLFTGFVKPEKRQELWQQAKIIVATPQGMENDLINSKISFENVSLIVFDEAHRATGDYTYVWLAKQYEKTARFPKILALTASPGDTLEKINEIIMNLHIREIEVRMDTDHDVKPYVQEVDITWVPIEFPPVLKEVQQDLKLCFKTKLKGIQQHGYYSGSFTESKTEMLKLQGQLQGEIAQGNRDMNVLKSLSLAAEAMKVQYAIELVETQGTEALKLYMEDIEGQAATSKIKAVQNLVQDPHWRSGLLKIRLLYQRNVEHPKLEKLSTIITERISKKQDSKIIIFSSYRDTGNKITTELNKMQNIRARLFVGQANKRTTGLSQKEQVAMLEEFRQGKYNVLVSSSVGEEGLDIPQVDLVVFYEPIPSAIRHIQRIGRTGRQEKGSVIVLMTKDTRDESYRWSAHHKQQRMYRTLTDLKKKILLAQKPVETKSEKNSTGTLKTYLQGSSNPRNNLQEGKKVTIIADYREKNSMIIKGCMELGVQITLEKLESADYLISDRVAVEFKTQEDFVDSLIDGRLLQQVAGLRDNFIKPLLVVEGDRDLYTLRNMNPNAIRGLLGSIAIDFSIPVLYTRNPKETAALFHLLAKREQLDNKKSISLHADRKRGTTKDLQEFIIATLPGIGQKLAKDLLKNLKSVKTIINASEERLREIEFIGEKKAKRIKEIIDKEYNEFE